jgi:NAD-dependent dihydropyrimidine dehydrogenase PreA subunit
MVRITLRFSKGNVDQPITSQVILEERAHLNILSAHMNQEGGEILIEIPTEEAERIIKAFREKGVNVDEGKVIEKTDRCNDCGGCISLCPTDALHLETDNGVELDEEKCLGITCGLCIDACPQRALNLLG